ncbi:MAG: SRPBCC domain-containing protein [Chitinophagaceae bacterium]
MLPQAISMANGKAMTIKKTFSRETIISIEIRASAQKIWQLLTNAESHLSWNSTIVSVEGKIAAGEKIKLISKLDPKRTFKLTVKEFIQNKKLVWGDAMGNRIYTLEENGNGSTNFTMDEKIGGIMFPLFSKYIPPFDKSFEQFAGDLKKAAENN